MYGGKNMSVHKIKISDGWELGHFKYEKFNRWYRYFGDWTCDSGKLVGIKSGDWFQAMAYPNCTPQGDYVFSCKFSVGENSLARINLNYEPRRLTKYAYYLGNDSNPYVVLVKAKSEDITTCTIHEKRK